MSDHPSVRLPCPRCTVSTIDPASGSCELCGFRTDLSGSPPATDPMVDLVTRELAHDFEILDIAGRREGAIVFRAEERNGGRKVALKVIARASSDGDAEAGFRSTMEAFQRLDHPHLVQLLRFGTTDSLLWCATAETDARTLRAHLADAGRMEAPAARRIATQLVSALEYLHRRQVVHGGIKLENVLIDAQGWVWLADPEYARPAGTERSSATDQCALAALLFECVTGEPPLGPGDRAAQFRPEVPRGMSRALARALAENPAQRFPSCADFLFALEQDDGGRLSPTGGISQPRLGDPSPATASAATPTARPAAQVLLVPDWEPPEDDARPKRRALGFIAIGLAIGALAFAVPSLLELIEASRQPAVTAAAPAVAASPPAATPPATTTPEPQPSSAEREASVARRSSAPAPSSIVPPATPQATRAPAPTPPPAEALAPAKLFINASPWGQVFIDDVLVGNTPRANLEVPPGEHVIRVSRQGFSTFTRTVRLAPGETLRITDIVLTPIAP